MQTRSHDQISRFLSKEANSVANSSFRVYYGGASGAVPFRWETRPGTPKHTFSESSIPPLTPPPSYFSSSAINKKSPKPMILRSFFMAKKTRSLSSGSSASSSSSLSSWSSSSSSPSSFFKRRRFSESPTLPFDYSFDDEGESDWSKGSSGGFRGCYQLVSVKNALLSIVGRGSAGRGTVN